MPKKERKTADELLRLMLAAIGRELPDRSIFILESSDPHTNWGYGTDTKIPEDLRLELETVLANLRLLYDLKT